MGELLRSKEMALGQLIIPLDVVVETMHIVGELGTIQFNDMNSNKQSFERRFVREIQRCDELQRILSLFKETIKYEEQREGFNKLFYQPQIINPIESSTEQLELTLTRFAEDLQQTTNSTEIAEMSLKNSKEIIDISRHLGFLLEEINEIELSSLKYLIGAIESDRFESLRVLLWRISRGFMLLRSTAIEQSKTCFVVFIQGEEVYNKIKMVCKSINARVLEDVPLDRSQRQSYFKEQFDNLELYANAFEQALESKRQCLKLIAEKINVWSQVVANEKSLYFTLNLFQIDTGHNHLIGEGWFPSEKYQIICDHLDTTPGAAKPIFTVIQKHPNDVPPTYLPTNSFTQCAQSLCETYSIPKYQEINPGFFYIITFPWLFGIMFGDGGHGIIITLFALVMIILQEKIKKTQLNEIFEMLFDSRYMILLMGLFSIYCGMIYNEWFGIQIDLFGTAWDSNDGEYYIHNTKGYVYIFGIDPIWKSSNNELYFYNSFKMKLSMLIGVLHMLFGIWMSLANHIHFKNLLSITFQFLPQIGFMLCSFGYLCFLILIKWVVPIENAPLITTVFLEMFQNFGIVSKENHMYFGQSFIQPILFLGCVLSIFAMTVPKPVIVYLLKKKDKRKQFGSDNTDDYYQQFNSDANDFIIDEQRDEMGLQNNASYDYYSDAHEAFEMNNYSDDVSTPLIDIPDVTKPYGAYSKRAKVMSFFEMGRKSQHIFREEDWIRVKDDPEDEEGNDLLEIVIFNSIQAMEYILGCISNTASYLRLWALSLAHAQLSTVFLEFVFYTTLEMKNFLLIFIGFAVFALSTLLILIGMESLSAFLHTLRLHWIEFQNKFYLGDGIPFSPFSFS